MMLLVVYYGVFVPISMAFWQGKRNISHKHTSQNMLVTAGLVID